MFPPHLSSQHGAPLLLTPEAWLMVGGPHPLFRRPGISCVLSLLVLARFPSARLWLYDPLPSPHLWRLLLPQPVTAGGSVADPSLSSSFQ